MKEKLAEQLRAEGHQVIDLGPHNAESTDYPDYAAAVGRQVAAGAVDRGILCCYTGMGMAIAANKIAGIRAALGVNEEEVQLTREHNDANVLTLGAHFTPVEEAVKLVNIFLNTEFSGGERHRRRISKIAGLEEKTDKL